MNLQILTLVAMFLGGAEAADPPPGGIKLLEGYKHEKLQGIDTRVGRIFKEDGITITYDIGGLAGNYAASVGEDQREWTKKHTVGDHTADIVLSDSRTLHVTFTGEGAGYPANFYAEAETEEQTVDMLLMVLGYSGSPQNASEAAEEGSNCECG